MRPLQKFSFYQEVYNRLAEEFEGWADLTEEQRLDLVDAELVAP
jgi:hypothetical protein